MFSVSRLDVCEAQSVVDAIKALQPSHVLHLAGIASPNDARSDPVKAWRVNLHGTLNLAHAILNERPSCRLVYIGSALVYGRSKAQGLIDEETIVAPIDEYGATKAAADLAVAALSNLGLRVVRLRPFNHTGPGQSSAFAIPAFAAQIATIEKGRAEPVIRVGNLDAERDFLDVRDVAAAYKESLEQFDRAESGSVFNIASGIARRMSDILGALLSMAQMEIRIEQDPGKMRPSDVPVLVGSAAKAQAVFGWVPTFDFKQTLDDVLNDCRNRIDVG
jgi:GDP-4-dehydro-6-deoxy-D-mannose reductase